MDHGWEVIISVGTILVCMYVAKMLKTKLRIFDKIVIPSALLAGFIAMLIGQEVLGFIEFDVKFLGNLIYHLMSIGFISLTLTEGKGKKKSYAFRTSLLIVSTYLIQAIVGITISLVFFYYIAKSIAPGFGIMLALGFGQGPGYVYSIGKTWVEKGITDTLNIGLSFSTFGFIIGGTIGVIAMNIYARRRNVLAHSTRNQYEVLEEMISVKKIKQINVVDQLITQFVWIAMIYLSSYLTIKGLIFFSNDVIGGGIGETLSSIWGGFAFMFSIIYALLFKKILILLKNKGRNTDVISSYLMSNISSLAFNLLIASSVVVISLTVVKEYLLYILIMILAGGFVTFVYLDRMTKKLYPDCREEYMVGLFGMLTGTMPTGMALMKGLDPDYESPAIADLVLASAYGIPFAIPLFMLIPISMVAFLENKQFLEFTVFGIIGLIFIVLVIGMLIIRKIDKKTG